MGGHGRQADQRGTTLSETIVSMAVAMMIVPVIVVLFLLTIGLLRYTDRTPTETSYIITGELGRAASLIISQQTCVNPQRVDHYSECVEVIDLPLRPLPDANALCWLAIRRTVQASGPSRVKQCWNHDTDTEQITVSYYEPSDTHVSDLLTIENWDPTPYSTEVAATGVNVVEWVWLQHTDNANNVILIQANICASLTDEELGRPHLIDLPRCGFGSTPDTIGLRLAAIYLAPGAR